MDQRAKVYIPKNPYPTPNYYPSVPFPLFESPSTFEKFDTDILFFIFYYQQGTYQQYHRISIHIYSIIGIWQPKNSRNSLGDITKSI